ncbi:MAG: 50S ribosomal protein L11 methyltransferase [Oligoflexales bacterium]|nr:50S ribosomal protein L11 methyltransferase [Oligoflexales bacterium]
MAPKHTYELQIAFIADSEAKAHLKEQVKSWLYANGEESFVEGALEDLDIDHEFVDTERNFYQELGGELSPISIYSYDIEHLQTLHAKLMQSFPQGISCKQKSMETSVWLEGWKESFKPIRTDSFYLYPPWEKGPEPASSLIPLIIDPGMAFGTGQHATTQVCLKALENFTEFVKASTSLRFLDVGTGSGVLSIAAKKMGFSTVHACDIDPNSIVASKANAKANQVDFSVWKGSVPSSSFKTEEQTGSYDLVVANILFVVLEKIIGDLAAELAPQGKLILSGILVEQKAKMLEKAAEHGLSCSKEWEQSDWSCLYLEKK